MFKRSLFILLVLVVSVSNFAQIPDGPYLGQTPPGSTPEIFAPNLVSITGRRDTKVVFSPDGQECFIGTVISNTFTLLYTKVDSSGHWMDPAEAGFLNKTGKREPFITPDGEKLFFTGDVADIYVSTKSEDQWPAASKVGSPISTSSEEWHPTVTMDGTIYFCSTRDGDYWIYRSRLNEGQYTEVERLDSIINTPGYGAWDPYIATDESYLIFTSQRPGGYGRADQYISYRGEDSTWSEPKNLGSPINTGSIEYGSYVSYDGEYYFLSRPAGWGPNIEADIYWVSTSFIDSIKSGIGVEEKRQFFELKQNFPNPFNSSTVISYSLSKPALVELNIYDILGNNVGTLVEEKQLAGNYNVPFEAKNLSSGIYFCGLSADGVSSGKKKMLLLK
jgi:hypothetical protein